MIGRKTNTIGDSCIRTAPVAVQNFYGHQANGRRDACPAKRIISALRNRTRHMRPMTLVVIRMAVIIHKVVARHKTCARKVRGQVVASAKLSIIFIRNPRINHCDDNALTGADCPRLGQIDIRIDRIGKVPLEAEKRISGHVLFVGDIVWLGAEHISSSAQSLERTCNLPASDPQPLETGCSTKFYHYFISNVRFTIVRKFRRKNLNLCLRLSESRRSQNKYQRKTTDENRQSKLFPKHKSFSYTFCHNVS